MHGLNIPLNATFKTLEYFKKASPLMRRWLLEFMPVQDVLLDIDVNFRIIEDFSSDFAKVPPCPSYGLKTRDAYESS